MFLNSCVEGMPLAFDVPIGTGGVVPPYFVLKFIDFGVETSTAWDMSQQRPLHQHFVRQAAAFHWQHAYGEVAVAVQMGFPNNTL